MNSPFEGYSIMRTVQYIFKKEMKTEEYGNKVLRDCDDQRSINDDLETDKVG